MTYAAKIIADSIAFGVRLTTFEVTFPRFILAEMNTHKMISKNSASSCAIPVERRIEQILDKPFCPETFTVNKSGMQADKVLEEREAEKAHAIWLHARDHAVGRAELLCDLGVHKQHANRLIEPFAWHTAVMTATEWENFFNLRCHPAAQPEMQIIAKMMREAYERSTPRELIVGAWHLPYVTEEEFFFDIDDDEAYEAALIKISVAKCAAVSFERQYVEKPIEQYVARHDSLLSLGHMSPFEHQAQVVEPDRKWRTMVGPSPVYDYGPPFSLHYARDMHPMTAGWHNGWKRDGYFCGNFRAPWLQYRKMLPGEAVFRG